MELSGNQFQELRLALQSAYPSRSKLQLMLREGSVVRLNDVAGNGSLNEVVAELVVWAEAEGKLPELVSAAIKGNLGNSRLRAFVESFRIMPGAHAMAIATGPEFEWRGPTQDLELQGFWGREPELWDVGFLKHGVARATSVCRIEMEGGMAIGTGVLIKQNLLLTNYHVFEDVGLNPALLRFTFGYLSDAATKSQTFQVDRDPVLGHSPTDVLDYVLLRIEPAILAVSGISPTSYLNTSPSKGSSIHVVQHPAGQTMKVAFGTNGITGVFEDRGLIQYIH